MSGAPTILRVAERDRPYLIMDKRPLQNPLLTFRARGVLAYLLSKPDNWRVSADQLAREGREGRDAMRAVIKELEHAGHIERRKGQDDQGRWITELVVYELPQTDDGKPGVGAPGVGSPGAVVSTGTEENLPTETNVSVGAQGVEQGELVQHQPPKRALTPAELTADRHAQPILEVIARGRAFNLTEELERAWTEAWQECIVGGLNPKPCGIRLLGYFYTALTGKEPASKDYGKLGALIGRWGKLALWGLDAALRRDVDNWLPYAQEVCARLWDEQQVRERARSVQSEQV